MESGPRQLVDLWESRVRRILLAAHVLPALFGLLAVILSRSRGLDIVVWSVALAWTLTVLLLGWRRSARTKYLIAWILVDATVMAGVMFIGTSARAVASLVAIEGALFAAVFVSAPIAVIQVGIAYSGLAMAEFVRARGSDLPSPGHGWQTPILVTLAGVLALRFLRSALDRLSLALTGRHETLAAERQVLAEAAREDAIARDVAGLERELEPALMELERLSMAYAEAVGSDEAGAEAAWLVESSSLARRELASLKNVLEYSDDEDLDDLVDTAILAAGAVHRGREPVTRAIDPQLSHRVLSGLESRAVAGFVREAVTNALFHGAPPISVHAVPLGQGIRILVCDGGAGFDESAVRGLGLEAIAELAQSAGGGLSHRHSEAEGRHEVEMTVGVAS